MFGYRLGVSIQINAQIVAPQIQAHPHRPQRRQFHGQFGAPGAFFTRVLVILALVAAGPRLAAVLQAWAAASGAFGAASTP